MNIPNVPRVQQEAYDRIKANSQSEKISKSMGPTLSFVTNAKKWLAMTGIYCPTLKNILSECNKTNLGTSIVNNTKTLLSVDEQNMKLRSKFYPKNDFLIITDHLL